MSSAPIRASCLSIKLPSRPSASSIGLSISDFSQASYYKGRHPNSNSTPLQMDDPEGQVNNLSAEMPSMNSLPLPKSTNSGVLNDMNNTGSTVTFRSAVVGKGDVRSMSTNMIFQVSQHEYEQPGVLADVKNSNRISNSSTKDSSIGSSTKTCTLTLLPLQAANFPAKWAIAGLSTGENKMISSVKIDTPHAPSTPSNRSEAIHQFLSRSPETTGSREVRNIEPNNQLAKHHKGSGLALSIGATAELNIKLSCRRLLRHFNKELDLENLPEKIRNWREVLFVETGILWGFIGEWLSANRYKEDRGLSIIQRAVMYLVNADEDPMLITTLFINFNQWFLAEWTTCKRNIESILEDADDIMEVELNIYERRVGLRDSILSIIEVMKEEVKKNFEINEDEEDEDMGYISPKSLTPEGKLRERKNVDATAVTVQPLAFGTKCKLMGNAEDIVQPPIVPTAISTSIPQPFSSFLRTTPIRPLKLLVPQRSKPLTTRQPTRPVPQVITTTPTSTSTNIKMSTRSTTNQPVPAVQEMPDRRNSESGGPTPLPNSNQTSTLDTLQPPINTSNSNPLPPNSTTGVPSPATHKLYLITSHDIENMQGTLDHVLSHTRDMYTTLFDAPTASSGKQYPNLLTRLADANSNIANTLKYYEELRIDHQNFQFTSLENAIMILTQRVDKAKIAALEAGKDAREAKVNVEKMEKIIEKGLKELRVSTVSELEIKSLRKENEDLKKTVERLRAALGQIGEVISDGEMDEVDEGVQQVLWPQGSGEIIPEAGYFAKGTVKEEEKKKQAVEVNELGRGAGGGFCVVM